MVRFILFFSTILYGLFQQSRAQGFYNTISWPSMNIVLGSCTITSMYITFSVTTIPTDPAASLQLVGYCDSCPCLSNNQEQFDVQIFDPNGNKIFESGYQGGLLGAESLGNTNFASYEGQGTYILPDVVFAYPKPESGFGFEIFYKDDQCSFSFCELIPSKPQEDDDGLGDIPVVGGLVSYAVSAFEMIRPITRVQNGTNPGIPSYLSNNRSGNPYGVTIETYVPDTPVSPGGTTTITYTIKNGGSSTIENVPFIINAPKYVSLLKTTVQPKGAATLGQPLTLAAGEQIEIIIKAKISHCVTSSPLPVLAYLGSSQVPSVQISVRSKTPKVPYARKL